MTVSQHTHRLASLALLVLVVVCGSVAFFVAWALAPVLLIGLFYVGFVLNEHRATISGARARVWMRERRRRLELESAARREDLRRGDG